MHFLCTVEFELLFQVNVDVLFYFIRFLSSFSILKLGCSIYSLGLLIDRICFIFDDAGSAGGFNFILWIVFDGGEGHKI